MVVIRHLFVFSSVSCQRSSQFTTLPRRPPLLCAHPFYSSTIQHRWACIKFLAGPILLDDFLSLAACDDSCLPCPCVPLVWRISISVVKCCSLGVAVWRYFAFLRNPESLVRSLSLINLCSDDVVPTVMAFKEELTHQGP